MGVRLNFINPTEIYLGLQALMFTKDRNGGGRLEVTSTLRDRTPQPQEKPLEDAEVIWGKASNFSFGSRASNTETGPYVQSSSGPPGDDSSDPTEPTDLQPIVYEWRETAREEKVVRIDGTPDGAYVDDARAKVSTFQLPPDANGRPQIVKITFLNFSD